MFIELGNSKNILRSIGARRYWMKSKTYLSSNAMSNFLSKVKYSFLNDLRL
jgi:hypothetical protein